jgi:hypothetical protein
MEATLREHGHPHRSCETACVAVAVSVQLTVTLRQFHDSLSSWIPQSRRPGNAPRNHWATAAQSKVDAKSRVLVGPQRALQIWMRVPSGMFILARQMTSDDRLLLQVLCVHAASAHASRLTSDHQRQRGKHNVGSCWNSAPRSSNLPHDSSICRLWGAMKPEAAAMHCKRQKKG